MVTTIGSDGDRRQIALIGGIALALAVLFFCLWYFMVRTPMATAFSDLKAADAALIVDELKRRKTAYELEDGGSTILVPKDQVDGARIAILGGDLPLKGTVGFELFNKSDMGLTEFAQKINYQRALQGELARTLMAMSNIESARVHITLPEAAIFQDDHRPAKASVTIEPKPAARIDARTVVGIQRLVASAVEDLNAENVVVLDSSGRQLSAELGMQPDPADGGNTVEQAYVRQIRSIAAQLISDPALRVTVWIPSGSAMPGNETGGDARPGERSFPLRITMALSAPSPALRERLVPLLRSTVGFDAAKGDSLTLVKAPPASPYEVGSPIAGTGGATTEPGPEGQGRHAFAGIGWFLALCTVAVTIFALIRRGGGRRRMTIEQRTSFAARLRELLDEDERLPSDRP